MATDTRIWGHSVGTQLTWLEQYLLLLLLVMLEFSPNWASWRKDSINACSWKILVYEKEMHYKFPFWIYFHQELHITCISLFLNFSLLFWSTDDLVSTWKFSFIYLLDLWFWVMNILRNRKRPWECVVWKSCVCLCLGKHYGETEWRERFILLKYITKISQG